MVWYQKFEYAISHWLQKTTEHVLGCVLCSPGCFSMFRASALMDDNVMKTYSKTAEEARHYVQYDQGLSTSVHPSLCLSVRMSVRVYECVWAFLCVAPCMHEDVRLCACVRVYMCVFVCSCVYTYSRTSLNRPFMVVPSIGPFREVFHL